MNCEETRQRMVAHRLGDLDSATRAELQTHLNECEGCRAAAQDIESTLDLLRNALAATPPSVTRLSPEYREPVERTADWRRRGALFWFADTHPRLALAAGLIVTTGFVWLAIDGLRPALRRAPPVQTAPASAERTVPETTLRDAGEAAGPEAGGKVAESSGRVAEQEAKATESAYLFAAKAKEEQKAEGQPSEGLAEPRTLAYSALPPQAPARPPAAKGAAEAPPAKDADLPEKLDDSFDSLKTLPAQAVRRLTEGDDKCEDGPVLRALKWLARRQAADGSWPGGIDATSVALLAFLGYEDGPASAGFSNSVRRAVDRLLAIQGADGRFGTAHDSHARATLAISKAYTTSGDRTLEPALRRATSILAADMEAATPPSVWMAQALKAVDSNRLAEDGLQHIVSRTTGQLRKSQDSYAAVALGVLEAKPEGGTASSTAAPRRNEALRGAASGGRAAAEASLEITDGDSADRLFFLTQQKLLAGDTNGAARSRDVLTPLIGRQNEDGSWPADTNQVYVTAMGALIAEAHGRKR